MSASSTPPNLQALMQQRIRQDVQSMHAYAIQDSRGMIKLDAMENPYPLPSALQQALGERLSRVAIHRYPGVRIDELRAALARGAPPTRARAAPESRETPHHSTATLKPTGERSGPKVVRGHKAGQSSPTPTSRD